MFNLIKNEILKIFLSKKVYVFAGLIVLSFFLPVAQKLSGSPFVIDINGQSLPLTMLDFLLDLLIPFFVILTLAESVTEEYAKGTLAVNLIHPVSRVKILTAKLAGLVVAVLVLFIIAIISGFLIGSIFFGWGNELILDKSIIPTSQGIVITLSSYAISLVPVASFAALIMLLTLYFTGSGAVVGASIGLFFSMSALGQIFTNLNPYLIVEHFLLFRPVFFTKDLHQVIMSLFILAVYGVITYVMSLLIFKKKDIVY